jgi:protein-disulfide isomerase/uncharacterized membrane protein
MNSIVMSPKAKFILMSVLSATGALISTWQTRLYFMTLSGSGPSKSFCNIGQTFDCTAVEMSKYAEFLPGVPLAAVAISGYLLIFGLALFALANSKKAQSRVKLVFFSGLALVFSVAYFAIMMKLGKLCILCLCVDGLNLVLFLIALSLPEIPLQFGGKGGFKKLMKSTLVPVLVSGLLAVGVTAFLVKSLNPLADVNQAEVSQFIDSVMNVPKTDFQVPPNSFVVGNPAAKITLVEFGDFQCPPCREAAASIRPLFKRYGNDLRFVFVNFPWSSECNPGVEKVAHEFACEAASVAVCASDQGKFLEVYENLFDLQGEFAHGKIAESLAQVLPELDTAKIKSCVADPKTLARIKTDATFGVQSKINTTPTFIINGRRIEGGLPTSMWVTLIDHMLQE